MIVVAMMTPMTAILASIADSRLVAMSSTVAIFEVHETRPSHKIMAGKNHYGMSLDRAITYLIKSHN